jgi:malonyl-CoA/methylmalonyl-CoA synthetase
VAVIVAESGTQVDENSIQSAIKGELARFKHPKHVYIVNELLCNAMGRAQNSS